MNIVIKPLLFVAFLTIVLNGQAQMVEILKLDKSAFMIDSRQKRGPIQVRGLCHPILSIPLQHLKLHDQ